MEEVSFGQYSVPVILTILLSVLYKTTDKIPNRFKSLISVVLGMALGIVAIPYKGFDFSVVSVLDHLIYGLMIGASATGLYELQRTVTKPR